MDIHSRDGVNLIDLLTKRGMVYHLTDVPVMSFLALQHRITIMLTFVTLMLTPSFVYLLLKQIALAAQFIGNADRSDRSGCR